MKKLFHFAAICLFAASVLRFSSSISAQTFDLKIYTAVEVEFATEIGKQYQVQGSSNLFNWTAIDQPHCGTGLPINRLFAARAAGIPASKFYRLQIVETNCTIPGSRGLLLLGAPEPVTVASNLLGVGGLTARQNTLPLPNDAVLFTVSLKDGPMPQTREQIMAIQGKQRGPAAIFLVDAFAAPDPELRELVLLETKNLLKQYQQPGVDAMPVFYDESPTILDQIRNLIASGTPP
jgi:hypothetical protein